MNKRTSILATVAIAVVVGVAAVVAVAMAGGSGHRVRVVQTVKNAKLGATVLATTSGRTLYSLSVERKGRFVCVDRTCLSLWRPLVVAAGVTPTGVSGLSTVTRPTGARQVAYRGAPLYTFTGDHARDQANGEGFKDVGVWHAGRLGAAPAPTTTGGGSGGYGGYGY